MLQQIDTFKEAMPQIFSTLLAPSGVPQGPSVGLPQVDLSSVSSDPLRIHYGLHTGFGIDFHPGSTTCAGPSLVNAGSDDASIRGGSDARSDVR